MNLLPAKKMSIKRFNLSYQAGFNLVELMIAVAIGMFLVLAAASLFSTNQRLGRDVQVLSRLQETGRTAIDFISRDVRMAGYYGCAHDLQNITPPTGTGNFVFEPIQAFESNIQKPAATTIWIPNTPQGASNAPINVNRGSGANNGGDGITVRYLRPASDTTAAVQLNDTTISIAPADIGQFFQNQWIAISDCAGSELALLTNDPTNAGALTLQGGITRDYVVGSQVSILVERSYYVDVDPASGQRGLMLAERLANNTNAALAFPGVEFLSIQYGFDATGNGAADTYVSANNNLRWDQLVAVKLHMVVRSERPDLPADVNYNYGNELDGFTTKDRFDRRVFSSSVFVRNNTIN